MGNTGHIASEAELLDQLENQNWNELWDKLMGRSFWVLRQRYGVKWSKDRLGDFARQSISDVLSKIFVEKVRRWNIKRYPDFEDFVIGAIDSHINNLLNKKRKEFSLEDNPHAMDQKAETVREELEPFAVSEFRHQLFDELEQAGADDNELLIFECLADGVEDPKTIKKEIGLSNEDFHNAWRRFKRRRKFIQQKLADYGY